LYLNLAIKSIFLKIEVKCKNKSEKLINNAK